MTIQWKSSAIVWVASVDAQTDASPMTEPTDRSMPPPGDDERHPDAEHADHRREPQDGQQVVDAGEPLARRDDADDAQRDQRDHQAEVAAGWRRAGGRPALAVARLGDPLDPGRLVGGRRLSTSLLAHAALPSMTRSSTRCSSMPDAGPSWTTRPSEMTRTRSARPMHLGDLAGDDDDGGALRGQVGDQAVDLGAGADVDAAGGLVEQQDPAAVHQPAREQRPSAGCRRTGSGRCGRGPTAARRAPAICSRADARSAPSSRNDAFAVRAKVESVMLR